MRKTFTRTLGTALLLLIPTLASAQQPIDHREHHGHLGCMSFGTSRDVYCNDGGKTVVRNFYITRPKLANGQAKESLNNAACQVYEGGRKVVVTAGALVGVAARATTCAVGKTVEGAGTVEHYIGATTQRAGQLIKRAGCDAGCYDRTNLDYRCP